MLLLYHFAANDKMQAKMLYKVAIMVIGLFVTLQGCWARSMRDKTRETASKLNQVKKVYLAYMRLTMLIADHEGSFSAKVARCLNWQ